MSVGAPVNTEFDEASTFIAPDQGYLLFMRSGAPGGVGHTDLFVSFRNADGTWSAPRNLGPGVNSEAATVCPIVSPDGRYLFFNSGGDHGAAEGGAGAEPEIGGRGGRPAPWHWRPPASYPFRRPAAGAEPAAARQPPLPIGP